MRVSLSWYQISHIGTYRLGVGALSGLLWDTQSTCITQKGISFPGEVNSYSSSWCVPSTAHSVAQCSPGWCCLWSTSKEGAEESMISISWILWHFGLRDPAPCWEKLRHFAQPLLSWRLIFWTFKKFFFKSDLYIPLIFFFFGKSTLRWMFLHLIDGDFGGTEDRRDLSRSS